MENTLENKAKFFALYWGQPIVYTGKGKPMKGIAKSIVMSYENSEKFQKILFSNDRAIELTSISRISDDDINALQIQGVKHVDELGYSFSRGPENHSWEAYDIDYLRSKGYALPYLDYSLETLIQYGWIKLKH